MFSFNMQSVCIWYQQKQRRFLNIVCIFTIWHWASEVIQYVTLTPGTWKFTILKVYLLVCITMNLIFSFRCLQVETTFFEIWSDFDHSCLIRGALVGAIIMKFTTYFSLPPKCIIQKKRICNVVSKKKLKLFNFKHTTHGNGQRRKKTNGNRSSEWLGWLRNNIDSSQFIKYFIRLCFKLGAFVKGRSFFWCNR